MWRRALRVSAAVALILVPVFGWWLYQELTRFPVKVTIATGSPGGRYLMIAESLQQELESQHNVAVELLETKGSLENLMCLRSGAADFALYQPGTYEVLRDKRPDIVADTEADADLSSSTQGVQHLRFVSNLYMQPVQFVVRNSTEGLDHRKISVGLAQSGDHAVSTLLLEHLGLNGDNVEPKTCSYEQIVDGLTQPDTSDSTLDAACITVASPAPILQRLFVDESCELMDVPFTRALTMKHVFLSEYTIPAGLYRSHEPPRPTRDVQTVAVPAQLLARDDVSPRLVREVAKFVLDKRFARTNGLRELLEQGKSFAQQKPEYAIHSGARSIYDTEFDIHVIESWEAAYSLAASLIIASIVTYRWIRLRNERKTEHKLDRYIRALLDIEERQLELDQRPATNDLPMLQDLLDEVTTLRQKALREFSMHELNEDRGAECFIDMCHGLTNKINAKITRQRHDLMMLRLMQDPHHEDGPPSLNVSDES